MEHSTREFAIDLARQAGDLLLAMLAEGLSAGDARIKGSPVDLVTDADVASERLIIGALRARFPGHAIHAEESAAARLPDAEWVWFVDPVDGTTNFAHGVPLFAVNIALAQRGEPVLGVTHDPSAGRTYWAAAGQGAWVRAGGRDRPLHVSAAAELGQALLCTGFPNDRLTNPDNNLTEFKALELRCHGVRRLGSAALGLAWVATGALDAFWEPKLKSWDIAAGCVLIREAGGRVSDVAGNPWRPQSPTLIASNGADSLHRALQEVLNQTRTHDHART